MRTKLLFALIAAQFIFVAALRAADADLPVLETKVKTAALFKNGLGFVISEGSTPLKDGWAATRLVPDAILGGIWFGCLDQDGRLEEVVGFKAETSEPTEAISTEELLKANVGKRVVVYYGDKTLTGRIKSVPDNRSPKADLVNPYAYGGYPPPVEYGTAVILETSQGDVALNKGAIGRVEFPDGMATSFGLRQETRNLKFRVAGSRNTARIGLSYLEKGISWTPAYLVQIESENKARITMQATVVNDAEDLEGAELFFVVGYPNFIYANVLSPMAMRQSITDFIAALSGGTGTGYAAMANVMAQSYAPAAADERGLGSYNYSAVPGLEGGYEEDLFLYNKQNVTLKKDERASYLVFSDRVDYKHVYEWEIPDLSAGDGSGYDDGENREQVWHSLRLTNSTQYPWTTAPAMAVRDSKPMAQDMINYTPKGAKVNLKLTVASDVKTDRQEYETDRQRDVSLYGYSYDLVTVKGELVVKNNKSSAITLDITKHITGEVLAASHDGKTRRLAEGISRRRANGNSIIAWEVPVSAGAEVKLTYSYKIYVSN